MSELCLIHGIPLEYDMRSGFELCWECEKDTPQPAPMTDEPPKCRRCGGDGERYEYDPAAQDGGFWLKCSLCDGSGVQMSAQPAPCPDCEKAAAHSYSDATSPGFFYDKCEKHRAAQPAPELLREDEFVSQWPAPHLIGLLQGRLREARAELEQANKDIAYWKGRATLVLERAEKAEAALAAAQRWIPVSERLPEDTTAVLVWCPERMNHFCAYYYESIWWIFGGNGTKLYSEVTHWRPLPTPPDTEEGNG